MSELSRAKIEATSKMVNTVKAVANCLRMFPPPFCYAAAASILKMNYPDECSLEHSYVKGGVLKILNGDSTIEEFDSEDELAKSLNNHPVVFRNVYEVDSGITHWIVAQSKEDCLHFMRNVVGLDEGDEAEMTIDECDEERLRKLNFKDDDGTTRALWDELNLRIKTERVPFELACTEY